MGDFIKKGYKEGWIKPLEDAFNDYPVEEEIHKGNPCYYICEEPEDYGKYNIGDIVYVSKFKYANNKPGINHLFVIIDYNEIVTLEYFGMLISSKLHKLKYPSNVLLEKDTINKLDSDSIVKADEIYKLPSSNVVCSIGKVDIKKVEEYKKIYEALKKE